MLVQQSSAPLLFQRYTEYVLRGRREAVIFALLFSAIPFFGWIGMATMALVTLRKGAIEGLFVLMWIALPTIVLAVLGHPFPFLYGIVGGGLVLWLLALVLRTTASWLTVIQVTALLCFVGILIVHLTVDDVTAYWVKVFHNIYKPFNQSLTQQLDGSPLNLQSVINIMAQSGTGLMAVYFALSNLFSLMIGRWLQSLVYNPGGLRAEIYNIRLNFIADILLGIIIAAAVSGWLWAWDVLPVMMMVFILAGLSLIHAVIAQLKNNWAWLILFYGLFIVLLPYLLGLVITVAIVDTWSNLRHRLIGSSSR